jgi:hypothetical protein
MGILKTFATGLFFVGLSRAEERLYFTKSQGNWPPVIAALLKDSNLLEKLPDI